jgi:hypothetical protein
VSIAQAVHESMVEKFKEDILNKAKLCPQALYDVQNPNCKTISVPQDFRPWMDVVPLNVKIKNELQTYDNIETKAGKTSELAKLFESSLNVDLNNGLGASKPSPLNALILDLSIKIGTGLSFPMHNVTNFINSLPDAPTIQAIDKAIIHTEEKAKKNINTLNLKQNSTQMCGLGKGTVDEPQIKCVPSVH